MPIPLPDVPARVVAAPMAGGPSTPGLVRAVGSAGGLGFLAGGYLSGERLAADVPALGAVPRWGVNLFVTPPPAAGALDRATAYGDELAAEAARAGVELGRPRWDDDALEAKVAVVLQARPDVVSFAFGLPSADVLDALHAAGIPVLATVTDPADARLAAAAGVDGLVLQGWEAGGHRGGLRDPAGEELALLPLLRLVAALDLGLPLWAAGGIADGTGVAAVLAAGAGAAVLGTAFLRCPEAGTSAVHAAALTEPIGTVVTRAFTGRAARALRTPFTNRHPAAPAAYPQVHHLTAPLRAAARSRGDAGQLHLWAGQAHALARAVPAAELMGILREQSARASADAPRIT